ncbi:hypothetical protein ABZW18_14395 [Streptomyces sp. NPDC004647]|uniref:hypothetical protein n=1 Tax=Streptomyces sp. NPDC004647 TaxID=3154671 RepID=UPI0033A2B59E
MDGHQPPVVVHPWLDGARRVTIRGESVGKAYSLSDVVEFLRLAGLEAHAFGVDDPNLIEWRGGGPADWPDEQA